MVLNISLRKIFVKLCCIKKIFEFTKFFYSECLRDGLYDVSELLFLGENDFVDVSRTEMICS
jgi:hypothetical protein